MPRVTSRHLRHPAIGASIALGTALAASTTLAQGASISVEPPGLEAGSTTLTVTGTGFSTEGNGVYVVFGPVTAAPGYYSDPSIYGAFRWVHLGAGESPVEATLEPDGSFSTTLEVSSTFTTPAGDIDCAVTACAVITFGAHGSPDRSQDTCIALVVGGSSASAAPSPLVTAEDPCAPISGGPAASGAPTGSAPPSAAASAAP
jgi:hypothetical protein